MKLTVAILACVAVLGLSAATTPKDTSFVVDKAFLAKQKFLFEILYRVEDPLQFEEYIKLGGKLIVDQTKYEKYDDLMVKFYDAWRVGGVLPKGEYFSAIQKVHILQAHGLFNFFYYAKDYDTLVQNIAWARLNINEGMFVYALTLAVNHRTDMKGLVLPSIYEIFPQSFFNSKFVYQAEKFDSEVFNRQILLEKELKSNYVKGEVSCNEFYLKDWKTWQWWKLMGLDGGFQQEEKTLLRDNIKDFTNDPKYKQVWDSVKAYYLPVDYTRDIGIFNEESKLSYFTEDVGLNAYWYYLNMDYPVDVTGNDRRGEYWIYNVQQLLARYYMERFSHGVPVNDALYFYGIVRNGYDPQLTGYNGNGFTFRKNYHQLESYEILELANKVFGTYNHVTSGVESGKFVTRSGDVIDVSKPEAIEFIGKLMQGSYEVFDKKFLGAWYALSNVYLTNGQYEDFTVLPHVLQNYETMLRDPISYQLLGMINTIYYRFKDHLPAYTRDELIVPGVKIEDVEVSELKTYFDLVDHDVSNLLNEKIDFVDGEFKWDKALLARQLRLNHIPYTYNIKVKSEQPKKVVVRTYLAPEFDQDGQKIDVLEHRKYIMQLDAFYYDLPAGESVIKRSSKDNQYTVNDQTTYTELYKYVMLAYEGKQDLPSGISQNHRGFPDRLVLPHGWAEGMPMKMFFVISQYTGTQQGYPSVQLIDNLPLGYPFDREINNYNDFIVPNMYFKNVDIYHVDKLDKYYPSKYDNYGHFDYDF